MIHKTLNLKIALGVLVKQFVVAFLYSGFASPKALTGALSNFVDADPSDSGEDSV
jgi:hypothetical protein